MGSNSVQATDEADVCTHCGQGMHSRCFFASRHRPPLSYTMHFLLSVSAVLQPIMLGDAAVASELASRVQAAGIFCVAFSYPVVSSERITLVAHHDATAPARLNMEGRRGLTNGSTQEGTCVGGLGCAVIVCRVPCCPLTHCCLPPACCLPCPGAQGRSQDQGPAVSGSHA
jgi:hypothetical protein